MNPVNANYLLQAIEKENPKLSSPEKKFLSSVRRNIASGLYLSDKQGKWLMDIYGRASGGGDRIRKQYLG